jgi:hypothetical protein
MPDAQHEQQTSPARRRGPPLRRSLLRRLLGRVIIRLLRKARAPSSWKSTSARSPRTCAPGRTRQDELRAVIAATTVAGPPEKKPQIRLRSPLPCEMTLAEHTSAAGLLRDPGPRQVRRPARGVGRSPRRPPNSRPMGVLTRDAYWKTWLDAAEDRPVGHRPPDRGAPPGHAPSDFAASTRPWSGSTPLRHILSGRRRAGAEDRGRRLSLCGGGGEVRSGAAPLVLDEVWESNSTTSGTASSMSRASIRISGPPFATQATPEQAFRVPPLLRFRIVDRRRSRRQPVRHARRSPRRGGAAPPRRRADPPPGVDRGSRAPPLPVHARIGDRRRTSIARSTTTTGAIRGSGREPRGASPEPYRQHCGTSRTSSDIARPHAPAHAPAFFRDDPPPRDIPGASPRRRRAARRSGDHHDPQPPTPTERRFVIATRSAT